ncbi:S-methyl-5-thioribose-1-phosphate isomerase [Clathrus columnatus]|uniref:Methylthioribose-1-phosphate isomerase n=1 Tax=Clathrus columnatus TaxID=1419009 RepID=A0AAV4ZX99_9AGAM|nr:S-methyl-5-thioribose-1-phosphate isomerase [Clathrus columnatus]
MTLHPNAIVGLKVDGNSIQIVDQLQLPHIKTYIHINSPDEAYDAIKSMKIRGAPAIASLAALSVSSLLSRSLSESPAPRFLASPDALKQYLRPILLHLNNARPTAVNLGGAIRRLATILDQYVGNENEPAARELAGALITEGKLVADEDVGRNITMSKYGAEWVCQQPKSLRTPKLNVLTVCNTGSLATSGYGTAFGLITRLHEISKLEDAFYTQSTPYHQGSRLTALELQSLSIPSTMICDSMVGSLFQHNEVHAVVVGADRIARNGDTANKIGTYNAAVLARRHDIPFVVVAPISTVDMDIPDGSHIPIEHRPAIEACLVRGVSYPVTNLQTPQPVTVQFTPLGIDKVYNPSFDVTPAELISAIVTEKGVAVKSLEHSSFDLSAII